MNIAALGICFALVGQTADVTETRTRQIPREIVERVEQQLYDLCGKTFFQENFEFSSDESSASPGCLDRRCVPEFKRHPWYLLQWRFTLDTAPWIDNFAAAIVDSAGVIVKKTIGIPNCLSNESDCEFKIDENRAIELAHEFGLEADLEDWQVRFIWSQQVEKYVWEVNNSPNRKSGRALEINASTGRLEREYKYVNNVGTP
jgi:hypothetical protein